MYILRSKAAVAKFKIKKLLVALRQTVPDIQALDCETVYFIHSFTKLKDTEIKQLNTILQTTGQYGKSTQKDHKLSDDNYHTLIIAIPRFGTISPWSSKATDLLHNCGMNNVLRIEKGIVWTLATSSKQAPSKTNINFAQSMLYDPMTETVINDINAAEKLFQALPPQPLQTIDLLTQGKTAVEKANANIGLALSDTEISYLVENFTAIGRNPTDVELVMFAQINSEHCRHKIFNAKWNINHFVQPNSLFSMIKQTYQKNSGKVLSAYSDNSAVIKGYTASRFFADPRSHQYQIVQEDTHILVKVETHNHPTAISPYAGAATGSGGEIRDEAATGRGAKPKAGLTGFCLSNLNIPDFEQCWENGYGKPDRIASALDIILDGPIGAASFNNEFGRPTLAGYFRTYEQKDVISNIVYGYHKPIMLAGGFGTIREPHINKGTIPAAVKIIVLGGPAMLIGLGGGSTSSMTSGKNEENLDFSSVQRSNPEMQRRCQEVIDACWALKKMNPVISIHDVGAGGLSNALAELVNNDHLGAIFELRDIPSDEPSMSPMAIWCNESQERYVLAIKTDAVDLFSQLCERERAPFAVIGETTRDQQLILHDKLFQNKAVDIPLSIVLGKLPDIEKNIQPQKYTHNNLAIDNINIEDAINRILHLPTVADKSFLITISDRSVSGLVVRDQMVGRWQTAVADCAVTTSSFDCYTGEAMSIGERSPIAVTNAPASGRMAIGEALTNIAAARIMQLEDVVVSANWMAACDQDDESEKLFCTVQAVSQLCQELGICIPVGKDSLSMSTLWHDREDNNDLHKQVISPLSLNISAFAPVIDVRKSLTPELKTDQGETRLLLIDLGLGKNRLGCSCLAQVYQRISTDTPDIENVEHLKIFFRTIQLLNEMGIILAYHDRSDGGCLTSLCEMAFASRTGIHIYLDHVEDIISTLFNEELGAVIQVREEDLTQVYQAFDDTDSLQNHIHDIGTINQDCQFRINQNGQILFTEDIYTLHRAWAKTSFKIRTLRDNPICARQEYDRLLDKDDSGLFMNIYFDADEKMTPYINSGAQPRIAILRDQGSNGHIEMAAAFHHAGFECIDVHMNDIIKDRLSLNSFKGLAACGGFSYGDVLSAGRGWANSILFNDFANNEFQSFFERQDTFTLGVCNGCQMLSHLKSIIPGAEVWPVFKRNTSEQFEARLVMVRILASPSIFFTDMDGAELPIVVAHAEGQVVYQDQQIIKNAIATMQYIDYSGQVTEMYPYNPSGSVKGQTGFTTNDGRFTIMMPHPERVFLKKQYSWLPDLCTTKNSPWLKFFCNARKWIA